MNQIKSFDLSRIGLLIKKEIFYQRRAPWIIIIAVFIMLLLFHMLMAYENPGANDLPSNQVIFYVITLFLLGTIFTSAAFNELNIKSSAHHYLSLPASHLEKLLSKWLVTGVLYVIVFNIFYFIFTVFSNLLTEAFFSNSPATFSPFERRIELDGARPWFLSQVYLVTHTVYLAGAVYFRKYAYFKTMIAQTTILFTLFGLIAGVSSLFFIDFWGQNFANFNMQTDNGFMRFLKQGAPTIGKFLFWVVFPLWMLSYSYFKLKETEV